MKKIAIICSSLFVISLAGCATTDDRTETGGGLIDPAANASMSSDENMECVEGDTRCETGGGLIDPAADQAPAMSSDDGVECQEGDDRCETGGGLIDPAQ